ncbi:MAG: ABC transporter ATP-binding protein [Clostridiales bacterium]|jgi:ABC-2 type transport system ATP-binding protein|nr:ABC transporter ATP-binding protein [Clostridiales bacterium]
MNIEVTNVSKSFDKKPVIRDLTFTIQSGDIVCLLGPSGAGKTTTIRLLIGAIAADKGEIRFDDIVVPNLKLLQKIGFMPQNDAMYDDLSGEDNLQFFAGLYGMGKNDRAKRIDEVLDLVDLTLDRKKFVRNYSGGMKKRLSLATALLHEPDVLLLDEPTVGIDPVLRRSIWNQFKEIKQSGRTLIVSTHVMEEVTECDKAALIYNGKLINYDTVFNLLAQTKNGKVEDLFFAAAEQEGGKAI